MLPLFLPDPSSSSLISSCLTEKLWQFDPLVVQQVMWLELGENIFNRKVDLPDFLQSKNTKLSGYHLKTHGKRSDTPHPHLFNRHRASVYPKQCSRCLWKMLVWHSTTAYLQGGSWVDQCCSGKQRRADKGERGGRQVMSEQIVHWRSKGREADTEWRTEGPRSWLCDSVEESSRPRDNLSEQSGGPAWYIWEAIMRPVGLQQRQSSREGQRGRDYIR